MKKLFSILMIVALAFSLATVAAATQITITDGAIGSEYAAYKVLDATDGGDKKIAYTINEKYEAILSEVTGKTDRAEIVSYIEALGENIVDFSENLYRAILAADVTPDYVAEDAVFADVEQGYYLIAETELGDPTDTFSLVMLGTAGEETLERSTKEDKPTISKVVKEENDSTGEIEWKISADHDIGDVIEYRIEGTVSERYARYNSYYYAITDTMDKGLTYNEDLKIYVVNGEDKYEVTEYFQIKAITDEENERAGFMAESNLKELDEQCEDFEITATTKIVIEYTATLNENAARGEEGNKNYAFLEYENNPYHDADGDNDTTDRPGEDGGEEPGKEEPSQTPPKINVVYTIDSVVNKVDENQNPLEGAGFTLYKWIDADADWKQLGEEMFGGTSFRFNGLDSGMYKIVETTVPAGYNKCKDLEFQVVGIYDETTEPHTMTGLKVLDMDGNDISDGIGDDEFSFDATAEMGVVSTNVMNVSGTILPETGGIGTTIFYIVGAVLAIGAVVFLVAKKRMNIEE